MNKHSLLQPLEEALLTLRSDPLQCAAFCRLARGQETLLALLPARYAEVWLGLVDRLESSALFAEESCSFSQRDLIDSLQMWLDKAAGQLQQD
jgi:hypothetical protein